MSTTKVSPSVAASAIESGLRLKGYASLGPLLTPQESKSVRNLYQHSEHFRSRIQMEQYRFGKGEYQYFAYPLPSVVETLRTELYATLAPIGSRWMSDLSKSEVDSTTEFPADHQAFLQMCHEAGQVRPTPLLLRYRQGDFNCLHQDVYGKLVFPFQVIIGLSEPGEEYEGGELLLVEQHPRAQSIGRAIRLNQGEGVVITTRYRPVQSTRGFYRSNVRHGVSEILSGERFTLGLIFHDAE
jgi:hypothetical protein